MLVLEIAIQYGMGNRSLASYKLKALLQRNRKDIVADASINNYIRCVDNLLKDNQKAAPEALVAKAMAQQPRHLKPGQLIDTGLMLARLLDK